MRFDRQRHGDLVNYFGRDNVRQVIYCSEIWRAFQRARGVGGIAVHVTEQLITKILTTSDSFRETSPAVTATHDHERFHVVTALTQPAQVESQQHAYAADHHKADTSKSNRSPRVDCGPPPQLRRHQKPRRTNANRARDFGELFRQRTQSM